MTTRAIGSETESAVSLPILFQILPAVVQPDLVLLQEPVQFIACFKTQEAPELGGRELSFAVRFKSDGFEGGTGEVLPGGRQRRGKFVWKIESELHKGSIGQAAGGMHQNLGNQRASCRVQRDRWASASSFERITCSKLHHSGERIRFARCGRDIGDALRSSN